MEEDEGDIDGQEEGGKERHEEGGKERQEEGGQERQRGRRRRETRGRRPRETKRKAAKRDKRKAVKRSKRKASKRGKMKEKVVKGRLGGKMMIMMEMMRSMLGGERLSGHSVKRTSNKGIGQLMFGRVMNMRKEWRWVKVVTIVENE